jgi:hypothetical protein
MRAELLQGASPLPAAPGFLAFELPAVLDSTEAERLLELVHALLSDSRAAVIRAEASPGGEEGSPAAWPELAADQWRLPDEEIDLGDLLDLLSGESWQLAGFDGPPPTALAPLDLYEDLDEAAGVLLASGAHWVLDVWTDALPYRLLLQQRPAGPTAA